MKPNHAVEAQRIGPNGEILLWSHVLSGSRRECLKAAEKITESGEARFARVITDRRETVKLFSSRRD